MLHITKLDQNGPLGSRRNLYEALWRSLLLSSWYLFPCLSSLTHIEPTVEPPSGFSDRPRQGNVTSSLPIRGGKTFLQWKVIEGDNPEPVAARLSVSWEKWPEREKLEANERES